MELAAEDRTMRWADFGGQVRVSREVGDSDIGLANQFRVARSLHYGSHYYSVVISALGIRQRIEKRMNLALP